MADEARMRNAHPACEQDPLRGSALRLRSDRGDLLEQVVTDGNDPSRRKVFEPGLNVFARHGSPVAEQTHHVGKKTLIIRMLP